MPFLTNSYILLIFICQAAVIFTGQISAYASSNSLDIYYIRYDVTFVDHRITDENLLMVPAQNEFRMEKFSRINIACVTSMTPGESKNRLFARARDQALKLLLKTHGLTSVVSENMVTIISYEGVVRTPVQIVPDVTSEPAGSKDPPVFSFVAGTWFAPLAFPDQWQSRKTNALIRKKLDDFLELIK